MLNKIQLTYCKMLDKSNKMVDQYNRYKGNSKQKKGSYNIKYLIKILYNHNTKKMVQFNKVIQLKEVYKIK